MTCDRSVVFSGHNITEILLKVALNTIDQTKPCVMWYLCLFCRWSSHYDQWWECKFMSEGVIDQGGGFRDSLSDLSEELCPISNDTALPLPFFIRSPNQVCYHQVRYVITKSGMLSPNQLCYHQVSYVLHKELSVLKTIYLNPDHTHICNICTNTLLSKIV